ncbi:MAG: 23S rRNA (uracil(1939)-C(5))-methyltransferase RlmD [Eggerthellaceae bacterium]|nr:23S rRNA (uracil(1939)-C(5))-methyltransferase RlmD [Eggerthellaceae bacterium]
MNEVVSIERMGYGSEAIAHLKDGKAVFVEGGCPGDVVEIQLTEEKSSFARARVESIVEPSLLRVDPPVCSASCGGCPWSHLSYAAQLDAKRNHVVSALTRNARFDAERAESLVAECVPSKREWGYRNKIEMGVGADAAGRFTLGFRSEGSHAFSQPDSCPVAHRLMEKSPKALRGALRYLQGNEDLGIFRVGVRGSLRTKDVEIALWTKPGAFPRAAVAKTLQSALKCTSIVRVMADPGKARVVKKVETLYGKGCWAEKFIEPEVNFLTSAPSFFQVNTAQAEKLVDIVLSGLNVGEGDLVADLYAGGGTFSVPLALAGADVIAVESAGSSVRDLNRNAQMNNVDIEVIGGDAGLELPDLGELDALVVDPPRAGLAKGVVESIERAKPGRVAYVSCDPQTWARDVARFESCGYRLEKATPVDLFPQTYHVETASIFVRSKR